jgi:hypothetical protein
MKQYLFKPSRSKVSINRQDANDNLRFCRGKIWLVGLKAKYQTVES